MKGLFSNKIVCLFVCNSRGSTNIPRYQHNVASYLHFLSRLIYIMYHRVNIQ